MATPADCKYAKEHEWAKTETEGVRIGISDYAQQQLGDVVYVDLPVVGKVLKAGESFMTVESVKAVSDIYAPVDGEVVAVNDSLTGSPELVNQSPYAEGWMVVVKPKDPAQLDGLLDAAAYDSFVATL